MKTTKFIKQSAAALLIAAVACTGCRKDKEPDPVKVTGVSLNKSTLTLAVGGRETLITTIAPNDAANKEIKWSISPLDIAIIGDNGEVIAMKPGTATITVTTDDGGFTATCTVTVQATAVAVTEVMLDKPTLTLDVGATETLTATVAPDEATDKNVEWMSSNEAVATVANGVVTAVATGTATITVTTKDGAKTATCTVTVQVAAVAVTEVMLDKPTLTLDVGATETLTATVAPDEATDKSVEWMSSNEAVVTVVNGVVTAVATGTATITVTTKDGAKTATCTITVKPEPVIFLGTSVTAVNWGVPEVSFTHVGPLSTSWYPGSYIQASYTGTANLKLNFSDGTTEWTEDSTVYNLSASTIAKFENCHVSSGTFFVEEIIPASPVPAEIISQSIVDAVSTDIVRFNCANGEFFLEYSITTSGATVKVRGEDIVIPLGDANEKGVLTMTALEKKFVGDRKKDGKWYFVNNIYPTLVFTHPVGNLQAECPRHHFQVAELDPNQ